MKWKWNTKTIEYLFTQDFVLIILLIQWVLLNGIMVNGIKLNQIDQSQFTLVYLIYVSSSFAFCYHLGNVIMSDIPFRGIYFTY
jgi:energy-coupling factor transporter transmembrane protein EcfT